MKRLTIVTFWVIMAILLVAMLGMAFGDAAETGEDPNIVGAVTAWASILVVTLLVVLIRNLVGGAVTLLFEKIDELFHK